MMHMIAQEKTAGFIQRLRRDSRAVVDFLYGTPERSRMTVLTCLMVYAYCMVASVLDQLAHTKAVCGL